MKSSLLAVALLLSVGAKAQTPPPLSPVQLIPAAAVVKPVKASSDEEALRQLRQAEAEFNAKKKAPVASPVKVPVAAPAPKVVVPNTPNNQQLPSIRRQEPVRPTIVVVAPVQRAAYAASTRDAAGIIASRCAATQHPLRCMNKELEVAELRVDSAEVRLLNCREIRKFDLSLDKNTVDGLVTSRMYQLRFKETQAFNAELAAAGAVSKLKTKEIELRATLEHLNSVSALDEKVCNARAFTKLYEASRAGTN